MIDFESQNAEVACSNVDAAMEKYRLGSLSGSDFLKKRGCSKNL